MARETVLRIRVSPEEHEIFELLAASERLPLATYVRRFLLFECERLGIKDVEVVAEQRKQREDKWAKRQAVQKS